ncbi:hypothetical protein NECAME_03727 [Necator americanus]|uniref:Uncharacterized protein n=1 Tax=Necator americanus TaxID=51031 RepID=W2T3H9_NECAM|nr:hypothetical protein NECAME_03727 [Necator americanus]ETN75537.1 hypothetical protein NECAME_03727 [Necator americanus]
MRANDDEDEHFVDLGPDGKPIEVVKKEEDGCINYKGDPLEDFTLLKFLDRFAFKNPKEDRKVNSGSDRILRKKHFDPWGVKKLPVSSKEYVSKKVNELPADERYLHRFASLRFSQQGDDGKKKEEDDWEIESVDSAEFDAIISTNFNHVFCCYLRITYYENLDRFEPGEANEEFDVDYSKEFTAEKKKLKDRKRTAEDDISEDESVDFDQEGGGESDEDLEEDEEDDEIEEDISEDDEDVELDSDSDEGENSFVRKNRANADFGDSDLSDDEMQEGGVDAAGEKFATLLESFEEEEAENSKKGKRKWKKLKASKRKRS